jgi:ABC-type nitrate/sulfonate/bicarbonate transport system substrate-binding protein
MGKIVYPVFLYGNCNWIKAHKSTTQKFVNAWVKAMKFISEHKKDTVDIMAAANKGWGIQIKRDEVRAGIYTGSYTRYKIDEASIQDSINFATVLYEKKKISKIPNIRASILPMFVDKAVAALK